MLIALRGAHGFAPAQAATSVAGQPVFHTGQKQHVSTAGSLTPPAVKDSFNTILEQSHLNNWNSANHPLCLKPPY